MLQAACGCGVGLLVGEVGIFVGKVVGLLVGPSLAVGFEVTMVLPTVGRIEGELGALVGRFVGDVGEAEGLVVGALVGDNVVTG